MTKTDKVLYTVHRPAGKAPAKERKTMTIYTTKQDYIDEITPALGEYVDDFDLNGIADEMLIWYEERDEDGNILMNHSGYAEREDVDFTDVIDKHEIALS